MNVDLRHLSRLYWDRAVKQGIRWTLPSTPAQVASARAGDLTIHLTPSRPVPRDWLGSLSGLRVLGLASAGGQQCPLLAAAGAHVTVFDNSPAQLGRDREVAQREGLILEFLEGDLSDLSGLPSEAFDLVFHPVSNLYVESVLPVWRAVARALKPGGVLLAGFVNPLRFLFSDEALESGHLVVTSPVPFSPLAALTPSEIEAEIDSNRPLVFGHTLEDQLGGQLAAGLQLVGLYEDRWAPEEDPLSHYISGYVATRALKPR